MSESYWLVYLYKYENGERLWSTLGIVEERETWQEWWEDVMRGEASLPEPFERGEWWISDRPVSMGLPDLAEWGEK